MHPEGETHRPPDVRALSGEGTEGQGCARPDIATLAIMEPVSKRITAAFERFKSELDGTDIKAELITFEPERDLQDSAFLGELQTVRLL